MLAVLMAGALTVGCGFAGGLELTLDYLEWDENVAVSSLTKVLLQEKLGYENVELKLMDRLELTGDQVNALEIEINEAGDPVEGARIWLRTNRAVVEPWVEAARNAQEG